MFCSFKLQINWLRVVAFLYFSLLKDVLWFESLSLNVVAVRPTYMYEFLVQVGL